MSQSKSSGKSGPESKDEYIIMRVISAQCID
jgi:hypothetical protein